MKLYDATFPGTRGSRVRWMLEELGVPYEVAPLDPMKGEHKRPEYLQIHPHGVIPAVEIQGTPMIESAAICMQLADTHADRGLAPAPGSPERAAYYQWIVYAVATLDEPVVGWIMNAQILPEPARRPEAVEKGKKVWAIAAPFLDRSLTGRTWILGDQFSTADVVIGYDLAMAARLGGLEGHPALGAYVGRLTARPAFQKAYSR